MVPNGWKEGRVRDLVTSLDAGVSVNSEDDKNLNASYKILKTSCVSSGQFQSSETKSVVVEHEISRLKEPVMSDSIIISRMNTPALVGANGYIEYEIPNTFLPDRLWQVKPKNNSVYMKWLGYWFASSHTRYTLGSTATGTSGSMKNITKPDVLNIKIDIPPLPEQRKIAKILGTWDKAINTTERLIDNSKQQKKALMQQLLTGKKRFAGFEGEWSKLVFGEIVNISSKKYIPTKASLCLPCIELEHIKQDSGQITGNANASKLASIKNHFSAGSVIFGKLRPYLRKFARPKFDGVCSTEIWVFETTNQLLDEYLFHFVQTEKFVAEANKSAGSKMPRADWGVVSELVIKIPELDEQQKIATVLTNADKEIELLEQQLTDLKQEKKALMQQLLTGKRRVTS